MIVKETAKLKREVQEELDIQDPEIETARAILEEAEEEDNENSREYD